MVSLLLLLRNFVRSVRRGWQDARFRALAFLVVLMLISGTIFYSRVEDWRVLDSFYFSVTSLTTVGYGDFSPRTDLGKIFTVFYLLVGVGILGAFIALLAERAQVGHRKKGSSPRKRN